MGRDYITYTTANNLVISFNQAGRMQCNTRELKSFAYNASGGIVSAGEKTFNMTIVCTEYGNETNSYLSWLLSDVDNDYGELSMNGWTLKCKCIGVASVEAEYNGAVKYVATFYAPKMLWYKKGDWVSVTGIGSTRAAQLYVTDSSFALDIEWSEQHTDYNLICKIYDYTEFDQGTPIQVIEGATKNKTLTTLSVDYLQKTVTSPNYTQPIKLLTDSSDVFRVYPPSLYYIVLGSLAFTAAKYRPVYLRGMPEWKTT